MRLVMNRITELPLLRPLEQKSDYIGTESALADIGTIVAEVQPVSALAAAEQYGYTVSGAILIYCELGTDIRERDQVQWQGNDYCVKSVLRYGNIIRAEAERRLP